MVDWLVGGSDGQVWAFCSFNRLIFFFKFYTNYHYLSSKANQLTVPGWSLLAGSSIHL